MQVKFCGLQNKLDVALAASLQCDAVGFVMVPDSRRAVGLELARELTQFTRQFDLTSVILVADADSYTVDQIVNQCQPDIIQFHGNESATFCQQFEVPYWKAVPMLTVQDWPRYIESYHLAQRFVLDTYGNGKSGGSGRSFSWFRFPPEYIPRLILAGGLTVDNLAEAVSVTGAEFIDVSSGIEKTPGVKSQTLMQQFMQAVNNNALKS